jgi:hypothetical protein
VPKSSVLIAIAHYRQPSETTLLMHALRRRLRPFVAFALVAMAALVLLPALGQAFAKSGGGFAEVCTPQGMKWVAVDEGGNAPGSASTHLEHCPWCVPGTAAAPPPADAARAPAPAPGTTLPPRFLQAPRTPHAWAAPRPRGPPVLG